MCFQASNYREKNFLDLNNDGRNPICLSYSKGGAWLKYFSLSNSPCTYITRFITNHVPIGRYKQRFFTNKSIACSCGNTPIKTRAHILYDCKQYQKLQNTKQESIEDVFTFLKFNHGMFCFQESITKCNSLSTPGLDHTSSHRTISRFW